MYSISYKSLDNYTIPVLDTFKKIPQVLVGIQKKWMVISAASRRKNDIVKLCHVMDKSLRNSGLVVNILNPSFRGPCSNSSQTIRIYDQPFTAWH